MDLYIIVRFKTLNQGFKIQQNSASAILTRFYFYVFSLFYNAQMIQVMILELYYFLLNSFILFSRIIYNSFGNKHMYSFKNSPLIDRQTNRPRRTKKNDIKRPSNQFQYKIANPFTSSQEQNFLPHHLRQQIHDMQYISPNSITKINFRSSSQSQRRSSNFARHLEKMQTAARMQEQKFQGLVRKKLKKKLKKKVKIQEEMIQQQAPVNICEIDNLSVDMENRLNQMNYRDIDNQQFSIFDKLIYEPVVSSAIFHSYHDIQPEINIDFSCYFNS